MKKLSLYGLAILFILATMPNCKKGGGGGGCSETALAVSTTPANNSTEPPAPGPDFPLQINITAGLPAAGVTIEIKAHPESSTTNFFTSNTSSTNSSNTFNITGTPTATSAKVDITITSKSCASNKWTGSYRYSRK